MKCTKLPVKMQIINLLVYGFFENCGIAFSHVFATKPRTDLCMTCQQNISLVMRTQNCEDIDKKKQYFATSGTFRFGAETTYGLSAEVHTIKKAFREIVDLNLNNHPVEILFLSNFFWFI